MHKACCILQAKAPADVFAAASNRLVLARGFQSVFSVCGDADVVGVWCVGQDTGVMSSGVVCWEKISGLCQASDSPGTEAYVGPDFEFIKQKTAMCRVVFWKLSLGVHVCT